MDWSLREAIISSLRRIFSSLLRSYSGSFFDAMEVNRRVQRKRERERERDDLGVCVSIYIYEEICWRQLKLAANEKKKGLKWRFHFQFVRPFCGSEKTRDYFFFFFLKIQVYHFIKNNNENDVAVVYRIKKRVK